MKKNALLMTVIAMITIAATASATVQEREPATDETLMGCLNPAGEEGAFQLTVLEDGQASKKILVTGNAAELGKYAKNHTVKVTGSMTKEQGRDVFKVSQVEQIDATCRATTE